MTFMAAKDKEESLHLGTTLTFSYLLINLEKIMAMRMADQMTVTTIIQVKVKLVIWSLSAAIAQ